MNEIQTTEIKQIEMEINFYKNQAVQSIFEIGERLNKAKELIAHGEWGKWLSEQVNFSQEQANRFMRVQREFPYSSTLTNLNQSKIFALLAVPKEERETFIEENPVEDMTTRELRQAIKDKKELEQKIVELENKEPITIEREVAPSDYEYYKNATTKLQDTISKLSNDLADKKTELDNLGSQKSLLERKVKLNQDESNKYKQLKDQIENLSKQKDDLGRQIKSRTELSGLVVRVEHMLKTELAPIKYSRAIRESSTDEIVTSNLRDIVERVEEWCNEMHGYVCDKNIINLEVIDYE